MCAFCSNLAVLIHGRYHTSHCLCPLDLHILDFGVAMKDVVVCCMQVCSGGTAAAAEAAAATEVRAVSALINAHRSGSLSSKHPAATSPREPRRVSLNSSVSRGAFQGAST